MITPEYTIEDTDDTVIISADFNGRLASKCDLVVADLYVKFNLSPYLLILDLPSKVSPSNIVASAKGKTITVRIMKEEKGKWPERPWQLGNKEEIQQRREESLQRLIEFDRTRAERQRAQKEAEEKEMMKKAWEYESEQKEEVNAAVKAEKDKASSLIRGDYSAKELRAKPLYQEQEVAPVRGRAQNLTVTHTPTLKDVPARYEGPTRTFIVPKKGDASPHWMKLQGDAFYKNGDYKSAVNAYTEAIDGSDRQFVAAFSNRAAARLKLGLYKLAINDVEEALKLIPEPVITEDVAIMKVRLLSRLTYAYFQEGRYMEAYKNCSEILRHEKDDETIKADLLTIETCFKKRHLKQLEEHTPTTEDA